MKPQKTMLIIMDGWGIGQVPASDAIRAANTPFTDSLYQQYPNTTLTTCGEAVGLPEGQMGNSEVGHLNLGAGRIVYQELQRINVAIREKSFQQNKTLQNALETAKAQDKSLHLIGLVSDGGVHSHLNHLKALIDCCVAKNLNKVYIHAFTDGRDCDPKSGLDFIKDLESYLENKPVKIASLCGRYYAMDRDNRWERIKLAYDALVNGKGHVAKVATKAIEESYKQNITDEFIQPTVLVNDTNKPVATIQNGDVVICFNFRTDRCREITQALSQRDFPEQDMHKLSLHYTTMTEYDKTFENVHVIFETDNLNKTLGQVLEEAGRTQIRIAETEKYPHVSFFFSGGREKPFTGEKRIMIPSPKVATYDLQPEMSAQLVTDAIVTEIKNETADFICLNYANADMVGHTGVWNAAIKAAETVDHCVAQVVTAALEHDYTIFLTADHGNSDYLINPDGTPNTAHTLNPVPLFVIDKNWHPTLKPGKLADIAPTLLKRMNIDVPSEMTGTILTT
ncbi:MAG TPA: 2,3-bisphosphoglycerate-independent phosphoglycerate mutase [Chitinophagaceae bacterium]|nr:2,3-bisphosphoglycerate-independent phosphoglycerate mutase [Chitinophagaceae bacterium]